MYLTHIFIHTLKEQTDARKTCFKSQEEHADQDQDDLDLTSSSYMESFEKSLEKIDKSFVHGNTVLDDDGNPDVDRQRANVCVVCDRLIIGMEIVKSISKEQLTASAERLSVASYEEHYCISLKPSLVQQYQVDDDDLKDLLLSPRAYHTKDNLNYTCCAPCFNSITRSDNNGENSTSNPPKHAIANGFAIGHIPRTISFTSKDGEVKSRSVYPENDLNDVFCAAISPVRPFGFVHAFKGGKEKSLTGHFSFFSVDQSHVGGVVNKYRGIQNTAKNIYVVLCGRMTPQQKSIARRQAEFDTQLYLDLLTWFAKESGHPGYKDVTPPDECPDPVVILQDEDKDNNTDESVDPSIECRISGKTYYFSNEGQQPNEQSSVFDNNKQFLESMLNNTTPTMLMYGGSYLRGHEVNLEDIFPIQFPYGTGGPDHQGIQRKVPVSLEECLRHYTRLSLNQFMRPDFILVCYHLLCRKASFTTGLIKCKSTLSGKSLAERISQLSAEDIKDAAVTLSANQQNNEPLNTTSTASSFLKSVTTSCKVLGHTTEAAKHARRGVYAMTEFFGPHSIFFTVTPDDECTFRVRMYANQGEEIQLPGCDASDDDCFADFKLRAKKRTMYPGACSLYYQSVIQAVYEMFGWDWNKNCKIGPGVFGDPEAAFRADEEQGRTTLHAHFLLWIKNFGKVRDQLFNQDKELQENARNKMRSYVEATFCSDYGYDQSLPVIHEECEQCAPLGEMFEQTEDLQILRDGRNKMLASEIKGEVLTCKCCNSKVSTTEVFHSVLNSYRKQNDENNGPIIADEIEFPPNEYRQDIMTYRYPIDQVSDTSEFYSNEHVRFHVATHRMNEHDWKHRKGCFKHGPECRFCFPKMRRSECAFVEDDDDMKSMAWRYVNRNSPTEEVHPYSFESKRLNGSQYLNTHSKFMTRKFGCNTNVQIGSPRCVFYVVHYSTKSTQVEDRGADYDKIGHQVIRRILKEKHRLEMESQHRAQKQAESADSSNNDNANQVLTDEDYCFREGLSRFLIGMSVHLSSDVVSATMAHLLISQKGSRFTFSHPFRDLLVGQMYNHLMGKKPGDFVLRRRNRGENKEVLVWADYSINDYLHRPDDLENISYYQFGMRYEKIPFSFKRMSQLDENGLPALHDGEFHFKEEHPGRRFCYLRKASRLHIPKLSTPHGMLCDLDQLELDINTNESPSENAIQSRIGYAKIALILFHPFRNESIWQLSDCKLMCYYLMTYD